MSLLSDCVEDRLERASLLPRANRRKTQNARQSEVEETHGQFGCLAIDNLYNIYDLTDRTPQYNTSNPQPLHYI